jgi:tetratricopeptide (TPR) repeat protein
MNPSVRPFVSALTLSLACLGAGSASADHQTLNQAILDVQTHWAQVMYETPQKAKDSAFDKLDSEAKAVTDRYPGRAEPLVWEAISLSSHAGVAGGLTGLGMAKQARDLLLQAERIDPKALDGSVYTSLGALYAKVPGWPIGFGDQKKAAAYFEKALAINPNGMDPNYLYGDFLFSQGRYRDSEQALERALHAPPRPNRPLADKGRKGEIEALLTQVHTKLADTGRAGVKGG